MRFLIVFLLIILSFFRSHATHVAGGSISYKSIGNNEYIVTLTYIRSCVGIAVSTSNKTLNVRNSCNGSSLNFSIPFVNGPLEISQFCDLQLPTSACINNVMGGPANSFAKFQWQDTITIPFQCDEVFLSFGECCRNGGITNGPANSNYYNLSMINTFDTTLNSSPQISFFQTPLVCVNQNNNISLGFTERDGGSLKYELVSAKTNFNSNANYTAPYSPTNPVDGISINSQTGEISLNPNTQGNFIVVVRVSEYNDIGVLVGFVEYETTFVVYNCGLNDNPIASSQINNVTGTMTQTGNYKVTGEPGDNVCFDIQFSDDVAQDLELETNLLDIYPSASLSINTSIAGNLTATICLTIPPNGVNEVISFICKDNKCPYYGFTSVNLYVEVNSTNCFISNFTANIGSCQPGSYYNVSGTIDFTTNINTDSLLVTIDDGNNVYDTVIFPPFISPTNWSISGLPANGNPISITSTFASDLSCTTTINSNAPNGCICTAQIGDFDVFVNGSLSTSYSLCYGDVIEIVSSNGFIPPTEVTDISGPDYNPGIGFLIYSCPPTIGVVPSNVPPNDNLTNDPCFIGLVGYGDSFIDTNALGVPNFSGTWDDNTIYIVPLTFYDTASGTYSFINTSLQCYEMGAPFRIQYLPKIDTINAIDNCLDNQYTINISGGLPSVDGSNFTVYNLLPSYASFESNSISNGGNIIINNLALGDTLSFEITDNNGCSININGGPFTCENTILQFYSAFTPNNDNINDTWRIDGLPEGNHSVKIFNRWGDMVWQTETYDNFENVWNGTNEQGEMLSEGVYYFITNINNQEYKGFIELTR